VNQNFHGKQAKPLGVIFCENSRKIANILATFCENSKISQEKHQRARLKVLPIEAGMGKAFGLPRRLSWQNLHKGS